MNKATSPWPPNSLKPRSRGATRIGSMQVLCIIWPAPVRPPDRRSAHWNCMKNPASPCRSVAACAPAGCESTQMVTKSRQPNRLVHKKIRHRVTEVQRGLRPQLNSFAQEGAEGAEMYNLTNSASSALSCSNILWPQHYSALAFRGEKCKLMPTLKSRKIFNNARAHA